MKSNIAVISLVAQGHVLSKFLRVCLKSMVILLRVCVS